MSVQKTARLTSMRITKQELEEFKQMYFKEFGVKLNDLEATKKAINLLSGIKLILDSSTHPVKGIDKRGVKE